MTDPQIQRATVFSGECRLLRWGESHKGRTVTLELEPLLGKEHPFKGLKTGESNGQRMMLVAVLIADDETPQQKPNGPDGLAAPSQRPPEATAQGQGKPSRSFKSLSRAQQAGIKLQDPEFCRWLIDVGDLKDEDADTNLKFYLGVKSKTELDTDPCHAEAWDMLLTDFDTRAYART